MKVAREGQDSFTNKHLSSSFRSLWLLFQHGFISHSHVHILQCCPATRSM